MIFVTVGTHEQQFNRLVKYIDEMKRDGIITEDVVMQTGFSTYEPKYCEWKKLYPYTKMQELVKEARIVITHGGPSSFIMPLQVGKIPIVVPRQKQFGEHVNDHQVEFCKAVEERQKNIIVVKKVDELKMILINYEIVISNNTNNIESNNTRFNQEIEKIIGTIMID